MAIRIQWVHARDETELHVVCTSQDALHSKTRQLERVVLHFRRHDRTTALVETCTPVGSTARPRRARVEFVERADRDQLRRRLLVTRTCHVRIELSAHDHIDGIVLVRAEVKVTVPVATARQFALLTVQGVEWVGMLKAVRLALVTHLEAKVLVHKCRLEAQSTGRVDPSARVRLGGRAIRRVIQLHGRLGRILVHGQKVNGAIRTLVKE